MQSGLAYRSLAVALLLQQQLSQTLYALRQVDAPGLHDDVRFSALDPRFFVQPRFLHLLLLRQNFSWKEPVVVRSIRAIEVDLVAALDSHVR